ncbi:BTB/POZ domain-containing protein 6-like [Paramacrobiotus metropolitanus]|uniref:BTB/POZ domain-containing protein 6-like n=1 Tax=Paramacrobiotus metropolitanus TaxID=2943436 RepID=UPI0024465B1E|nr:BTB/POZ domain-containing protein 6-like [Paramacrobiotus metropolitanus]
MSRKPLPIPSHPQPRRGAVTGIVNRLQGSLRSGELSDIKFVVGREYGETRTFSALKCILSLSSDVFYAMFHGSLPERKKTIEIPDVLPEAFEVMLCYVYTDKADITVENVWPVLYCADKYDFPLLLEQCNQFVLKQIRADNCLTYLEKATKWHADDIVKLCFTVADAYTKVAFESPQFVSVSRETLQKLLQRSTLRVDENTVYIAVERWCVEACKQNNQEASAASRRAVLGEALVLIRFPLLEPSELADGPAKTGLLSERELLDLYTYTLATTKPPATFPFSTEEREPQPFRLRRTEFQFREKSFVEEDPDSPFWMPAKVIGVLHSKVVVCLKNGSERRILLVKPGKVMRAADFLTNGRDLVCHCSVARCASAVYQSSYYGGSRHTVKACGRKEVVDFRDLFVRRDDAQKWKNDNDSGDDSDEEEEREGPIKKRMRE